MPVTSTAPSRLVADVALDLPDGPVGHGELVRAVRDAVVARRLRPGTRLPSSRDLAPALGCSRWVVTEAYGLLVAEGTLVARTGSGTWVPDEVPQPRTVPAGGRRAGTGGSPAAGPRIDLAPGVPDRASFPRARWKRALAAALARATHEDLAVRGSLGLPELRVALGQHLAQTRGARIDATTTVAVTRGSTDAFDRLLRVLRRVGQTHVALAEPSPERLRVLAAAEGLTVVGIGRDAEGPRVEDLHRSGARALVLAPAGPHPVTPGRRAALLRWAREVDGVLIEDDADGPLAPPRRSPVLQADGPDRVILVGSVETSLGAGVALGWLVLPEPWMHSIAPVLPATAGPPALDQLALTDLVTSGDLLRHVRRMRARYRQRGRLLADALAGALPGWTVDVPEGGLRVQVTLPDGCDQADAARVAAEAERDGLVLTPAGTAAPGFVLGFANLTGSQVDAVAGAIGAAARRAARSAP
jgi:GntR family transcriptional regulator / MocR family aminotransferase